VSASAKFKPHFTGTYQLVPAGSMMRRRLLFKEPVALYDFQNDSVAPLTFWRDIDSFIRPFRHFDKCDFGSVPTLLQSLVSPTCAARAFIIHDAAYEFHSWWTEDGLVECSQREADDMLYHMMRAEGCSVWLASKAWAGVRAGGWTCWRKPMATIENARRLERASMPGFEDQPAD
jgi:hypothetical protein